jgi:ribosomal protein L40E
MRMSGIQDESPEQLLCANCFAENAPDADFCRECGRPLSPMATIDPLRRTYSLGYWFRCAVQGRLSPFGFWGTWLVLGSTMLASLVLAMGSLLQTHRDVLGGISLLAQVALLGTLLARMTVGYMRARREPDEPADPGQPDAHVDG